MGEVYNLQETGWRRYVSSYRRIYKNEVVTLRQVQIKFIRNDINVSIMTFQQQFVNSSYDWQRDLFVLSEMNCATTCMINIQFFCIVNFFLLDLK